MAISAHDRNILRDLAKQVAAIAAQPVMAERRADWTRHNRLERVRPMILVFPEGSWRELLPDSAMTCEDEQARKWEWELRSRIYQHENIDDDTPIEKTWIVHKGIGDTGWGLAARQKPKTHETGTWAFDPVILEPADLKKLHFPEISYDEAGSHKRLAEAQDLFGDILDVQLRGVQRYSFHLMAQYTRWRGLEQVMLDMCTEPNMLHDAMAFLEEGHRKRVDQLQAMNLLDINNDGTYHSSGGLSYSDQLPASGYDGEHVRPCDMWCSAEAQEMAQVGPEMHEEFILQYERRLLQPFGLNGYGCCEDLTQKLDDVLTIPNIRRISIAPWADVDTCAHKLKRRAIFSWKPHPAHLVGDFDTNRLHKYIRHTIDAANTNRCVLEMILKDTHTCENHPERFTQWVQTARKAVAET